MAARLRPWRVQDGIGVRYVSGHFFAPVGLHGTSGNSDRPFLLSPDGKRFCFLTFRANLSADAVSYELLVFETGAVEAAVRGGADEVKPSAVCKVESQGASDESAGIVFPSWADNDIILFRVVLDDTRSAYSFDVRNSQLTPLTAETVSVTTFDARNGSVIYTTIDNPAEKQSLYPMARVTQPVLDSLYSPLSLDTQARRRLLKYRHRNGKTVTLRELGIGQIPTNMFAVNGGFWMAPSGDHCFILIEPDTVPKSWERYRKGKVDRHKPQFVLLDLRTGNLQDIFAAPWGALASPNPAFWGRSSDGVSIAPQVFWFEDGVHAAVVNTCLPLDAAHPERESTNYICGTNALSFEYLPLCELGDDPGSASGVRVGRVGWTRFGRELVATREAKDGRRLPGLSFTVEASGWTVNEVPADVEPRLSGFEIALPDSRPEAIVSGAELRLEQSANEPPVVRARAKDGRKHATALLPPDSHLANIARRPLREVRWTDPDGEVERGGLTLPEGRGPFPLVVQAFHYAPDIFLPDGAQSMAHCTQAFAAAGMAVLDINIPGSSTDRFKPEEIWDTPREMPFFVGRLDRAIDELASQGLVDRTRVGVVGFSRGGAVTTYLTTHPGRTPIRAAINAEGMPLTFSHYLLDPTSFGRRGVPPIEAMCGNGAFWRSPKTWLEHCPSFNYHRVNSAFMIQVGGVEKLHPYAEFRGGFFVHRRPFEWAVFPGAGHNLRRPRQRLASMKLAFDWMNFWLADRESGDAEDQERNARWRRMRAVWDETLKQEAAGHLPGAPGEPRPVIEDYFL